MSLRRTQRHPCPNCNGNKVIESSGDRCGNCEGRGYIDNPPGLESVCPSCNGEGYSKIKRTCNQCNGQGFTVRVYELTEDVNRCLSCGGTGLINEEVSYSDMYGNHIQQRQVKCLICDGNGFNTSFGYRTIK